LALKLGVANALVACFALAGFEIFCKTKANERGMHTCSGKIPQRTHPATKCLWAGWGITPLGKYSLPKKQLVLHGEYQNF
jgi:hypothetical protein